MSAAFITNSFKNLGYLTSEEWLDACIEWCKENQPPNQTNSQLLNSIKEQYLLCDIRQDGIQSKGNRKTLAISLVFPYVHLKILKTISQAFSAENIYIFII